MVQTIEINLKDALPIETAAAFTQGDYAEASLAITIKDNDQLVTGDTGAQIVFERPDGYIVVNALTGRNGSYSYSFIGNELESPGKIYCKVTLSFADGRVSTAGFTFIVRSNPMYGRQIDAGPYVSELEKIIAQAEAYLEYLRQLAQNVPDTALTHANLQNDFLQTMAGVNALDAAAGKRLADRVQTLEDTPAVPAGVLTKSDLRNDLAQTVAGQQPLDAAAAKLLLAKTQVVNNLAATVPGNVLDATMGKQLQDSITQLNSKIKFGEFIVPPVEIAGYQKVRVFFDEPFDKTPTVFIAFGDNENVFRYISSATVDVKNVYPDYFYATFKRDAKEYSWRFVWFAIC